MTVSAAPRRKSGAFWRYNKNMPRPKIPRCVRFKPNVYYFKPRGVPLYQLEEVALFPDELEALKLHDVDGLDQIAAAKKMKISQPTFARILESAHKKVSSALIKGQAIKIEAKIDLKRGATVVLKSTKDIDKYLKKI